METAGRYYGKDQANRERSDLSACLLVINTRVKVVQMTVMLKQLIVKR